MRISKLWLTNVWTEHSFNKKQKKTNIKNQQQQPVSIERIKKKES